MQGRVSAGEGKAATFVPTIADLIVDEVGFRPVHGTFNLTDLDGIDDLPAQVIEDPTLGLDNCRGIMIRPCTVAGIRSACVRPLVDSYPDWKVELVAPIHLRDLFGVSDGDIVPVSAPDDLWSVDGPIAHSDELDLFDGVVFELEQTLVDLQTDRAARQDNLDALLLDVIPTLDCPVGICTTNTEGAMETALERFGVRDAVDTIVARETPSEQKPHPGPVRLCLDQLDVLAGNAVLIGADRDDCEAATKAGTSFLPSVRISVSR